jgi:hypothetical protein
MVTVGINRLRQQPRAKNAAQSKLRCLYNRFYDVVVCTPITKSSESKSV